jgi:hypothetical protein
VKLRPAEAPSQQEKERASARAKGKEKEQENAQNATAGSSRTTSRSKKRSRRADEDSDDAEDDAEDEEALEEDCDAGCLVQDTQVSLGEDGGGILGSYEPFKGCVITATGVDKVCWPVYAKGMLMENLLCSERTVRKGPQTRCEDGGSIHRPGHPSHCSRTGGGKV